MTFVDPWSGHTLSSALRRSVEQAPDRTAFVFREGELTYAEVLASARWVGAALTGAGVRPGDRVAVVMAGHLAWPAVYYGIAETGGVIAPLNTRLPGSELRDLLMRCGARAVIDLTGAGGRDATIEARVDECLELCGPAVSPTPLPVDRPPGLQHLRVHLLPPNDRSASGSGEALVLYTSGSTGRPKAAALTHEGTLRGSYYATGRLLVGQDDRFFSPQPFFHAGGAVQVMNAPLTTGCVAVVQDFWDAGEALEIIERQQCTIVLGHQPHWVDYLACPDVSRQATGLRAAFVIGDTPIRQRIHDEIGLRTVSPYGMTETHLGGACPTLDDPLDVLLRTHGTPHPGIDLRIAETNTGAPLPPGEIGEILLGGPWCGFAGYLDDEGRARRSDVVSGYFSSGDLGYVDDRGLLIRTGRIKDMIRVGGENVAAAEIEAVIAASPHVAQVRVIARPDDRLGEVPVAVVATTTPHRESVQEDVMSLCRRRLAGFQMPRHLVLVHTLPIGPTGKIDGRAIESLVAEQLGDGTNP